jgi:FlaA1/EpsC-like NDP-sugar epimerase
MENRFTGSTIMITGGTGSWGQELTKQLLLNYAPKEIRIYSRSELNQVKMKRAFDNQRLVFYIGDVRDKERLNICTKDVDYFFHLAALKHVPVCEENPWEAVATNIIGTQNAIEAAIQNNVKNFIDVSTDKAVDPYNLYGVTKACGEKLVIAANNNTTSTHFVCIRGGNVLGTNGSVIPLFKEQIERLNEITITSDEMTRFFMRIEDAIALLLFSSMHTYGGETVVMKMPSCRIIDLAQVMINRLGNKSTEIKHIGIRPGEKLHEVLVSKYDARNIVDKEQYFIILPNIPVQTIRDNYKKTDVIGIENEYSSLKKPMMTYGEIESMLEKAGWLANDGVTNIEAYLKTIDKETLENIFQKEGWIKQNS